MMFQQQPNSQQRNRNSIESSLHGFASMMACIAAFMVAPQIYELSSEAVFSYLLESYKNETVAQLGVYAWTFLATACVFFLCRALMVLAMMMIAQRLLFYAI